MLKKDDLYRFLEITAFNCVQPGSTDLVPQKLINQYNELRLFLQLQGIIVDNLVPLATNFEHIWQFLHEFYNNVKDRVYLDCYHFKFGLKGCNKPSTKCKDHVEPNYHDLVTTYIEGFKRGDILCLNPLCTGNCISLDGRPKVHLVPNPSGIKNTVMLLAQSQNVLYTNKVLTTVRKCNYGSNCRDKNCQYNHDDTNQICVQNKMCTISDCPYGHTGPRLIDQICEQKQFCRHANCLKKHTGPRLMEQICEFGNKCRHGPKCLKIHQQSTTSTSNSRF